ncbi:hypothetical protein HanIR_Chr14g0708131 [Helianthus annuus]|nr:hypothetical protein HanIR_Chr14g0708131 [Helianthus annuus]
MRVDEGRWMWTPEKDAVVSMNTGRSWSPVNCMGEDRVLVGMEKKRPKHMTREYFKKEAVCYI